LRVPYSVATQIAGMINPNTNFDEIVATLKKTGHIPEKISSDEEKNLLKEFTRARNWVETYSPQQLISFVDKIDANKFTEWKELFAKSIEAIQSTDSPEEIQQKIYEIAKELNLQMKDAFKAFYQALIDRERGPRLGTLIIVLGKDKVISRLEELSK
jgi:lysyl-tRNA synthetase class 1